MRCDIEVKDLSGVNVNDMKTFDPGNNTAIRLLCLAGILGGLVLFCGDQLFYFGPFVNLSSVTTIATVITQQYV